MQPLVRVTGDPELLWSLRSSLAAPNIMEGVPLLTSVETPQSPQAGLGLQVPVELIVSTAAGIASGLAVEAIKAIWQAIYEHTRKRIWQQEALTITINHKVYHIIVEEMPSTPPDGGEER